MRHLWYKIRQKLQLEKHAVEEKQHQCDVCEHGFTSDGGLISSSKSMRRLKSQIFVTSSILRKYALLMMSAANSLTNYKVLANSESAQIRFVNSSMVR